MNIPAFFQQRFSSHDPSHHLSFQFKCCFTAKARLTRSRIGDDFSKNLIQPHHFSEEKAQIIKYFIQGHSIKQQGLNH